MYQQSFRESDFIKGFIFSKDRMTFKICVQTHVFGNYMSLSRNREKLESEIPAYMYMYVKKNSKLFVEKSFIVCIA